MGAYYTVVIEELMEEKSWASTVAVLHIGKLGREFLTPFEEGGPMVIELARWDPFHGVKPFVAKTTNLLIRERARGWVLQPQGVVRCCDQLIESTDLAVGVVSPELRMLRACVEVMVRGYQDNVRVLLLSDQ